MNFEKEKYEYLLHTWGGFYNEEHKSKHGLEPGYFWFSSKQERKEFRDNLKEIEMKYGAHCLMASYEEGRHTRYRTIARMKLIYNGKEYPYEYDFGFGYSVHTAYFMWEEGNYSCDCNRSLFLSELYDDVKEVGCGNFIKAINLTVVRERFPTLKENDTDKYLQKR